VIGSSEQTGKVFGGCESCWGELAGDIETCEASCKRTALSLVTVSLSAVQASDIQSPQRTEEARKSGGFLWQGRFEARRASGWRAGARELTNKATRRAEAFSRESLRLFWANRGLPSERLSSSVPDGGAGPEGIS
jgi:hypothetical protein